jgi:hypothetical protein
MNKESGWQTVPSEVEMVHYVERHGIPFCRNQNMRAGRNYTNIDIQDESRAATKIRGFHFTLDTWAD